MSHSEKLRAIILKRIKYGEADLVLHTLTPQGGRLACLARGALKSKRRFAGGVLEPTHFIEIVYKPNSRHEGLANLEEARLVESFDALRTSYEKLETALALLQMIDKVAQDGDTGSQHLFDLLGNGLRGLQTAADVGSFRSQFSLKLLYHQGVLETEPWIGPFLKTPLTVGTEVLPTATIAQQRWVHEQIETYLITAETF